MYSYYKYVIQCDRQSKCNIASMIVGAIASFGVTMVGAFQWTNVLVPHLIGAALAFFGAAIYSVMIVYISWNQLVHKVHTRWTRNT
uniref:DNA damage-regulated autophagy modulator protein 1-like n=1 Tax=Phallusia mammillata TaxID=59560 RepID=A0A6F9DB77_9ASCI|nr:DNA damage-regulated autophagy modulator protein 1-like [Phallusia mammillata]